jgi:hypothetical protein
MDKDGETAPTLGRFIHLVKALRGKRIFIGHEMATMTIRRKTNEQGTRPLPGVSWSSIAANWLRKKSEAA